MVRVALIALLCTWTLCAQAKVLYTGTSVPGSQGWAGPFFVLPQLDPAGFVRLDTTTSSALQDGYARTEPLLRSDPGFRIDFTAKVESETHGNNNRAGFSMIVTDQNKHGIELGFWTDHVWAQNFQLINGTVPTFTHGTDATFVTTDMTDYSLTVVGGHYTLRAGGTQLFNGDTIFYDAPGLLGSDVPYRTPNVLFFGDDTTSAAAKFDLKSVSVVTVPEPAALSFLGLGLAFLVFAARASRGHRRG